MNKKIAICYDFDGTLSSGYMYEYKMLPDMGYKTLAETWSKVYEISKNKDVNEVALCLNMIMQEAKEKGITLNKQYLQECGRAITFFNGVSDWCGRINQYGKKLGIDVEHYIITSGNEEIVRGIKIADVFKHIFGSKYLCDDCGMVIGVGNVLLPFNKIDYVHRISRGVLNHNEYDMDADVMIPISDFIYIGDGETDIPCMKEIHSYGGHTIMVYENENKYTDECVDYNVVADYSENSDLDNVIKNILRKAL